MPTEAFHPAFWNWANAGSIANFLREWFRDITLISLQAKKNDDNQFNNSYHIITVVNAAIEKIFKDPVHIEYNGERRDIVAYYSNGRVDLFGHMSSGQRAFIGLVADIAYRAFELNGTSFGTRTLTETTGLVLIDEIDLHLHPKWQRQIVPALKEIFPKIQFFATTHSPQVIGECKPEEIVLLGKDGKQKRPPGSFGMDSNWILECVMEAEGRNPDIARRVKSVFDLIDDDKIIEAKTEIARLRQDLPGVAPDIVSAEAYIWNLEHNLDEAAE